MVTTKGFDNILIISFTNRSTNRDQVGLGQTYYLKGAMHSHISPSKILPLPTSAVFNLKEINDYISTVLHLFKKQDSYGLFTGVCVGGGLVALTLVFGIPGVDINDIMLPPTPEQLPVLVRQDWIVAANQFDTMWSTEPVNDLEQMQLEPLSLGIEGIYIHRSILLLANHIEGSLEAGSFGGFLRRSTCHNQYYGLTAAHCVPGARSGASICCPSTLEVTARFNQMLRYSDVCPPVSRLQKNPDKNSEARALVAAYRFNASVTGVSFLDSGNDFELKTGTLSGAHVREIVSYQFENLPEKLFAYDQHLQGLDLPSFGVEKCWETRMDWCVFSCDRNR